MSDLTSDSSLQYIRGVGPARAEQFASLGLRTVGELLEYFPFRVEHNQGCVDIVDLQPDTNATIRGTVTRVGGRFPGQTATIHDGTGTCKLRWFQRPHGREAIYVTVSVIASGKVKLYNDHLEMVQPSVRVFPPDTVPEANDGGSRIVGVYRGSAEISSTVIRKAIEQALTQKPLPVAEFLPAHLLTRHQLPLRADAIRAMHAPRSETEADRARRRLAYEEFLLLELGLAIRRRKIVALNVGHRLSVTDEIDRRIRARFPFGLTDSQNEVIKDISLDVQSGRPMTRLLQGDVGSGKTVVALYACLLAVANRRQAAIMTPTEILAQQHYANIERYLAGSRVRAALLLGGLPRRERDEVLSRIERGEIDLIVGTQALIEKDIAFRQLAMVIVDEQHKFGVVQRAEFRTKGPMPHYLVMTATPIPRTLAMTVFGDLDVSVIKHAPPGRGRIITKVVTDQQWQTVMEYVRGRLAGGEQAFVVCPRIGDDPLAGDAGSLFETEQGADGPFSRQPTAASKRDLLSVRQTFDELTRGPWQGLDVGLLHGAQPAAEKHAAISAFSAGKLHAVVSTTVVEVGVDVPNATIMIVEHAERFGLSQLHQLRGRVGRGARDSLCVLIARGAGLGHETKAAERLKVMTQTTDGFRIAEADLKQRGPGELLGTRQHGLPELRIGSLVDDFALLELARADAFEIVKSDPGLKRPEHKTLLPALQRLFGDKLAMIDAA